MSDTDKTTPEDELIFEEGEPEFEILRTKYEAIPDDPDDKLPEQYRGKTKEDLILEIEAQRAQREELAKRADPVSALSEGIDRLGQTLSRPVERSQDHGMSAAEQQRQYDERLGNLRKRLDGDLLQDTEGVLDEYNELKLKPLFQQLLAMNIPNARRLAQLDPEVGPTMQKYGSEVDAIVNKLDLAQRTNSDVYIEAAKRVRSDHYSEMVQEEVKRQIDALQKPTEGGGKTSSTTFFEGGVNSRPAAKGKVPPLSESEKELCFLRGWDEDWFKQQKYGRRE